MDIFTRCKSLGFVPKEYKCQCCGGKATHYLLQNGGDFSGFFCNDHLYEFIESRTWEKGYTLVVDEIDYNQYLSGLNEFLEENKENVYRDYSVWARG